MNSDQLLQFKKVAELQHMTHAANELYVTQANLSRSISSIERELGTKLFDRVGRGIKLNEAGKIFYQHTCNILSEYAEAKAQIRQVMDRQNYQISLATNVSSYTPKLFSELNDKMPGIRIRQITAPRKSLVSMLLNGRVDFVITAPPIKHIGIDSIPIFTEYPEVIYPEGHWLTDRTSVALDELSDESLIGLPSGYGARDSMAPIFEKEGIVPSYLIETSDTGTISGYVENGLGIAIIPKSMARIGHFTKDHCVDLDGDHPCPVALSWRTGFGFSETERQFVDIVSDYFDNVLGASSI